MVLRIVLPGAMSVENGAHGNYLESICAGIIRLSVAMTGFSALSGYGRH